MNIIRQLVNFYCRLAAKRRLTALLEKHSDIKQKFGSVSTLSTTIIDNIWSKHPAACEGRFDKRPGQLSLIFMAMAEYGVEVKEQHETKGIALLSCLQALSDKVLASGTFFNLPAWDQMVMKQACFAMSGMEASLNRYRSSQMPGYSAPNFMREFTIS